MKNLKENNYRYNPLYIQARFASAQKAGNQQHSSLKYRKEAALQAREAWNLSTPRNYNTILWDPKYI